MTKPVKTPRRYDNSRRREQALATRRAILAAARELMLSQGYATTTVAQVAARAGVNTDTVYSTIGRKPELMRELVEVAISGEDHAVPAEERDYVAAIQRAPTAREKLATYARAIALIHSRLGPVFIALRDAAATDPDCRAMWAQVSERRAANMRRLATDLRSTGDLRDDLTDDEVADVIWSMNAPEYWDLLVGRRGWSADQFADWLADAWHRLLLA